MNRDSKNNLYIRNTAKTYCYVNSVKTFVTIKHNVILVNTAALARLCISTKYSRIK